MKGQFGSEALILFIYYWTGINRGMSTVRDKILAEEEIIATRRRFGLFSQLPPLAVGDNRQGEKMLYPKGQNGKPITKQPQMLAGACRTGMNKSSYFNVPTSLYSGDLYKDKYKQDLEYEMKNHRKSKIHESDFIPSSGPSILHRPSFNYIEDKPQQKRPKNRDENGKVKVESKNFVTNPITKVEHDLLKPYGYIIDPYERKSDLENRRRNEEKKRNLPDAPMFRSMSHGSQTFSKNLQTYGQDNKALILMKNKKARSQTRIDRYPHETRFKLARRGHGDPLSPYPQHLEQGNPERSPELRKSPKGKESWKPINLSKSRPTPSISFLPRNINLGRGK